ncbi:MAG: hypothetical protein AB7O97_01765 [Planctomycetota bacterium]
MRAAGIVLVLGSVCAGLGAQSRDRAESPFPAPSAPAAPGAPVDAPEPPATPEPEAAPEPTRQRLPSLRSVFGRHPAAPSAVAPTPPDAPEPDAPEPAALPRLEHAFGRVAAPRAPAAPTPFQGQGQGQGGDDAVEALRRAVERVRRARLSDRERADAARALRRLADHLGGEPEAALDTLDRLTPEAGARKAFDDRLTEMMHRVHGHEARARELAEHARIYTDTRSEGAHAERLAEIEDELAARADQERARAEHLRAFAAQAHEHFDRMHEHMEEHQRALAEGDLARAHELLQGANEREPAGIARAWPRPPVPPTPPAVDREGHPDGEGAPARLRATRRASRPAVDDADADAADLRRMMDELRDEMEQVRALMAEIRGRARPSRAR